jgi:hypothetical protein
MVCLLVPFPAYAHIITDNSRNVIRWSDALTSLTDMLRSQDVLIQRAATESLGKFALHGIFFFNSTHSCTDFPSENSRAIIVQPDTLESFINMLKSKDRAIRTGAVESLGRFAIYGNVVLCVGLIHLLNPLPRRLSSCHSSV